MDGSRTADRDLREAAGGFSLLELTLVMTVLAIAFLALSRSVSSSMQLTEVNRESALATDGVRDMIERLQGEEDFTQVLALYDADPSNDPGGPGTAPGKNFAVPGLAPDPADPDGFVGEVVFPVVDNAGVQELREDVDEPDLGMPRDLDGLNGIDTADHSGDYALLPVEVRVQWVGKTGIRHVEARTLLTDR